MAVLACLLPVGAADLSANLLNLSAKGQTDQVRSLLDAGANVESRDKNGRTPLMLAAGNGRVETVRLLLARGADAGARDGDGWTAYGWTLLHKPHDEVLKILPTPDPFRLVVEAAWSPEALISSCFMSREQLLQGVDQLNSDGLMIAALGTSAKVSGRGLLQVIRANRRGMAATLAVDAATDADAILGLQVRPGAACVPPSGDNLSMSIEVSLLSGDGKTLVFHKTFGAGLKGLHTRAVSNASQYSDIYQAWADAHAREIHRSVLAAMLTARPKT